MAARSVLVALGLLLAGVSTAQAAPLDFESVASIPNCPASVLALPGETVFEAESFRNGIGTTIGAGTAQNPAAPPIVVTDGADTVTFDSSGSAASVTRAFGITCRCVHNCTFSAFFQGTNNCNLNLALNNFAFDCSPTTVCIHNLTPGTLYTVEAFAVDDRTFSCAGGVVGCRTVHLSDGLGDFSSSFKENSNSFVTLTFVANSSSQSIESINTNTTGGNNRENFNALIVFQPNGGSAPEVDSSTSTVPLALAVGVLLLAADRRR